MTLPPSVPSAVPASQLPADRRRHERGAALTEFAVVAVVAYLLMAGTLELGRALWAAHVLQGAARTAARALATAPSDAEADFDAALAQAGLFDPAALALDLSLLAPRPGETASAAQDRCFAGLPLVNRMLRPLFRLDEADTILRYPGTLLALPGGDTSRYAAACGDAVGRYTVQVPQLDDAGTSWTWRNVVEEIAPGEHRLSGGGVAGVRLLYPFQSSAFASWRARPGAGPRTYAVERADTAAPATLPIALPSGEQPVPIPARDARAGAYGGAYGLGRMYAMLEAVRPFRRVLESQALFPREVFF